MSLLEEYCSTAKRGSWRALGRAARDTLKMTLSGASGQYQTTFSAATEGAYFAWLEGNDTKRYGLILVAPDNSINWSGLSSMTVTDAMAYLSSYTTVHSIPGWGRFVRWFDSEFAQYGGAVTGVSICGRTASSMPSYSNPAHNVGTWWAWLRDCALNANCSSVYLSGYKGGNYRYRLPMVISTAVGTIQLGLILTI